MHAKIPDNCKEAPACIDYRSYVFTLPHGKGGESHKQLTARLIGMGRLRHEMLGVFYVDTEWGLLVVPPTGFPDMKVHFFHHITEREIERILADIAEML